MKLLWKAVNYNFKVQLREAEILKSCYFLENSKKNNPALDIGKYGKENAKNGLSQFDQYQMEKYEKLSLT
jgi:hypothetical protein